jgi:phosphatidate cytidylyltransferase
LPIAVVTALILAGLIFGTLFTSRLAWFVVVAIAVLGAQSELYRAFRSRGFKPADAVGLVAGAGLLVGAYLRGTTALSFTLAMTVIATFLWFLADPQRARISENIAVTLLGVVYVPFLGAHVVLMDRFPHGAAITICYIGIVAASDIGAYAAGSFFGKHPMAPSVSPKKTWEGAAGATTLMFVLALAVGPHIAPFHLGSALAVAAVAAVVAPLGDLAESLLKRDLGVKDMGGLLPGHGGMLDRIDALLFALPGVYFYVKFVFGADRLP